jgi:alpha-tubulin suppressor-like RCC1 family protein
MATVRGSAWMAIGSLVCLGACGQVWGFRDVTLGAGGAGDAGPEGGVGVDLPVDAMAGVDSGMGSEAQAVDDATTDVQAGVKPEVDVAGQASGEGICAAAELWCDGGCVANDAQHCGSCTNDCTLLSHVSAASCTAGGCSFGCAPGYADCNANAQDGCETGVTGPANCGGCGVVCGSAAPLCVAGRCRRVTAVAAGGGFTCGLLSGSLVECWGDNTSGALGNGSTTNSPVPTAVLTPKRTVSALAAGGGHACALFSGGSADCWGANSSGQLGDGSMMASSTPVAVSSLSGAMALGAGLDHTCALLPGGGVECWGGNSAGELGNGTTADSPVPIPVSSLSGATGLSAGFGHSCAVLADGGVDCWGSNSSGQLGNGSTVAYSSTPVPVSNVSGVMAVATGLDHTCAVLAGGSVDCWGDNSSGQLGTNLATTSSPLPLAVSSLGGVVGVSAGFEHTCVLLSDSTVKCWGANSSGQLGNGTTAESPLPVAVSALSGVSGLAAGAYHSCALLSDGGVECWGDNQNGELGDGTTTNSSIPRPVGW